MNMRYVGGAGHVIFAAFSGGSTNAPKRSRAQLRAQAYLRSFICSVVALDDTVHLFLYISPLPTLDFLSTHLAHHPRVHLLPAARSSGARLQHARFSDFLALLRAGAPAANATKVVLTDATDVVFQADPFHLIDHGLYTAEESARYTLGSHASNAMWVRETYGEAILRSLSDSRVVCSGVTMGTTEAIISYLELMVAESAGRLGSARLNELRKKHGRDLCRGLDQGLHNVLVRTRLQATASVLPSGRSAVFHGNAMSCGEDVMMNHTQLVYVTHGLHVPIVVAHQFGRIRGQCQRHVRRMLTCRADLTDASGSASSVMPQYCDVCSRTWPQWLGDSTNSWRHSAD